MAEAETTAKDAELRKQKIIHIDPRGDFVLLVRRPMPSDRMTEGGIILPDEGTQQQQPGMPVNQPTALGTVVRVGPKVNEGVDKDDPLFITEGANVVFNPWPMKGCSISLDQGLSAQVLVPLDDIYAIFSLNEPTDEDIKAMKQVREAADRARRPALLVPDKRLVTP